MMTWVAVAVFEETFLREGDKHSAAQEVMINAAIRHGTAADN